VPITVEIKTRVGAIADLITVFSNMRINIGELNGKDMDGGNSRYHIAASVNSAEQLELLMNRLRRVNGVSEVQREHE